MKNLQLQKIIQGQARTILVGAAVVFLLVVGILSVVAWSISVPKGRVSCASFGPYGTQADAQTAYNNALRALSAGAYWLDKDGDGRPCETIYNKAYPKGQGYGE